MGNSKAMPRLIKYALWCILGVGLVIAGCNWWIVSGSNPVIYRHPVYVPSDDVALVLGTSPRVGSYANPFFEGRMDTAAKLWKERKARRFLVSGDHGKAHYDETAAMQDALIKRGVPKEVITQDHAGFRTLDSMVRAREVFGVTKVIVVTDDWHLPRALFLAKSAGLEAVGAAFVDVPYNMSASTRAREYLSRVKAVADIYVLRTKPRFLGEHVELKGGRQS